MRSAPPNDLMIVHHDGALAHIPNAFAGQNILTQEASTVLTEAGLLPTLFNTPGIANIYPDTETNHEVEFLQRIIERETKTARILDVGCGVGRLTIPLVEHGYLVEGVDISHKSIAALQAKFHAMSREVSLFVADVANFSAPDRYGFAFSAMNSLRYLATPERLRNHLSCMRDSLHGGAKYLINFSVQSVGASQVGTDSVSWETRGISYTWTTGIVDRLNHVMDEVVTIARPHNESPVMEVQQQTWIQHDFLNALFAETGWRLQEAYEPSGRNISQSAMIPTRWLLLKNTKGETK